MPIQDQDLDQSDLLIIIQGFSITILWITIGYYYPLIFLTKISSFAFFLLILSGASLGSIFLHRRLSKLPYSASLVAGLEAQVLHYKSESESFKILIESKTMQSQLGEMAQGIAHEINNPLSIVKAYLGQLQKMQSMQKLDPPTFDKYITKCRKSTDRIANIVKGLKSCSRNGESDPFEWVSLKGIIQDATSLCQLSIKNAGIPISTQVPSDELLIYCRSVQICQVIVNLLNNAKDAIKDLPQKWIALNYELTSKGLLFKVIDSGEGIPLHIQKNMLKPFFTTKIKGEGTGLGLGLSQRIIEDHDGQILITREKQNTSINLSFPSSRVRFQDSTIETLLAGSPPPFIDSGFVNQHLDAAAILN